MIEEVQKKPLSPTKGLGPERKRRSSSLHQIKRRGERESPSPIDCLFGERPKSSTSSILENNVLSGSNLPPEIEKGNVEYKLKLINYTEERYLRLVSQMKWRLGEGSNMALYEIGVEDDGTLAGLPPQDMTTSLATLKRMAGELDAELTILQQTELENGNLVAEVLVRRTPIARDFMELRIAMIGGTDAGKSTLLGVLSRGQLDNGRGKARLNLLSHRHEIETGKTSSISHEIIGFDAKGGLINYASTDISSWEQICEKAGRVISFVDLAGSQKYLRTTVSGLVGHSINFVCLVVGGLAGVTSMTKEHLELAVAIDVPVFVVVSKIDCCTPQILQKTLTDLLELLSKDFSKTPLLITNEGTLENATDQFHRSSSNVPIFMLSTVTGKNLNLLTKFLGTVKNLDIRSPTPIPDHFLHIQIEDIYTNVPDVGLVVGGTVVSGGVQEGDLVWIGPDPEGNFEEVEIASIHRQRTPVTACSTGHHATFSFRTPSSGLPSSFLSTSLPSSGFSSLASQPVARSLPKFPVGPASSSSPTLIPSSRPGRTPSPPQTPSFALRRGMSLVSGLEDSASPRSCWSFAASVMVVQHPSSLRPNFQAVLHIGAIRQQAVLEEGSEAREIAAGEQGIVRIRFLRNPEFLRTGMKLLFRDGAIKVVGHVVKVFYD